MADQAGGDKELEQKCLTAKQSLSDYKGISNSGEVVHNNATQIYNAGQLRGAIDQSSKTGLSAGIKTGDISRYTRIGTGY